MFQVEENKDLKSLSTMKIGGHTRYFSCAKTFDDVKEAYQKAKELGAPLFVVGGGSNIVWNDTDLPFFVLQIALLGFEKVSEDDVSATFTIGAGENWDHTVERFVALGLSGVEAMSAIPGTVGATPVQNVGAYGQEIKDTLLSVKVFDTETLSILAMTNEECRFRYRDSIFKSEAQGRYIVLSVTLKLSKNAPMLPAYPGVAAYFSDKGITNPTLRDIREAIISIRREKLPDPSLIPNCGSFFENPIVEKTVAEKLLEKYPTMKHFSLPDGRAKIPAGWLLEHAGFKGEYVGRMRLHDKNALVITNPDGATFADLIEAKKTIIEKIKNDFGIVLESEPNIIE